MDLQVYGGEIRDRQRKSPEKFPGFLEFEKRKIARLKKKAADEKLSRFHGSCKAR